MASESTEEQTVTVHLPPELHDWLDDHAREQDLDRETLLRQLLASYRQMATEGVDGDAVIVDGAGALEDRIEVIVAEQVADAVEGQTADRISEARNAVQKQLGNRIDSIEANFREKLDDVRERVIQVKKEADRKAPKDHTHAQFEQLGSISERFDDLEAELDEIRDSLGSAVDGEGRVTELENSLERVEERLQTVAWVVSDLREAQEASGALDPVDRIKRAAAKADIQRAKCENCGEGVTISLLTDPECPHCEATVSNVEPASGFFGKPTLLVASQLESGETR